MRDKIAQALGIQNLESITCQNSDNTKWLITDIKEPKIVINEKNSNIFLEYNLSFKNCFFGEFCIKDKKDERRIKGIKFINCDFNDIKLENTSYSDMRFEKCKVKSFSLNNCKFSYMLIFIKSFLDKIELTDCDFGSMLSIIESKIREIAYLKKPVGLENVIKGTFVIQTTEPIEKISLEHTVFSDRCSFAANTFNELNLSHCVFKKFTSFFHCKFPNDNIEKNIDLSHSIFEDDVDFSGCSFGTEVDITKTIDLSSITFEKDAKFDESVFNYFVAFHTTSFKGTASFYKCKFNTIPNFSPADFKGILNINNVVWGEKNKGFGFKNIKELVEKAYNSNDPMENVINLRNSFSGIKHKLIEQDNLLEAQDFHKAELYCKEIELRDRIEQEYLSNRNKAKIKINSNVLLKERFCVLIATLLSCWFGFFYFEHKSVLASFLYGSIFVLSLEIFVRIVIWLCRFVLKECNEIKYKCSNFDLWFDLMILLLYRYTSEHHTNINRILHVLLIVIVSYGFILFVSDYIVNYALGDFLTFLVLFCIAAFFFRKFFHQNMLLINLKVLIYFFLLLIFVCLIAKITYILCYIFSIFILFSFYSLKNSFCIFISRAIIYFITILILAFQPEILSPIIGINKSSEYKNSKLNELMDNISYDKLVALASNVTQEAPSALNTKSPREIIIENKNIIKDSTELNASFDSIKQAIKQDEVIYATRQSMSVIYLILLILCIFSLQKTARKNTIVPS